MPEAKKTNTLIEKTILVLKTLQIHMKKRHSAVLQNASSKKSQHSHCKNNSGLENTIISNEKPHITVLQNAWSQKNKHSHWKNNSGLKKPYKFIWKNGTAPSYKMPDAKKTNTLIEKSIITESTYIENKIKNFTIFTAFQELRKNDIHRIFKKIEYTFPILEDTF